MPNSLTGYLHPDYAASLAEFGELVRLPRSGGYLLRRRIPGTDLFDAIGTYPYLTCVSWHQLADDLDELETREPDLVSVTAAPDPFGDFRPDELRRAFPDLCNPYKQHYVADLTLADEEIVAAHHMRKLPKVYRSLSVEVVDEPVKYLSTWLELFEHPIRRFSLTGIRAFSARAFQFQLSIPGVLLWLVKHNGEPVAAALTMLHNNAAHAHLLAATPLGRKLGASYALYHANIQGLRRYVRWIDWGAVPGNSDSETGLKKFKSGWATGTQPAYLCGRICNRAHYERLARETGTTSSEFFPCYRSATGI